MHDMLRICTNIGKCLYSPNDGDDMTSSHLPCTYAAPSDDFLQYIFLSDFQERMVYFDQAMRNTLASSISVDQTFKVGKNIGVKDRGHWTKQYTSLFIVLNEKGQVVSWAFTKSTKFEEIRLLMCDVRDRLQKKGHSLRRAYLDNCCKWKAQLRSVFGPGLEIRLDLFHAVQRITSAVPKRKNAFIIRRALFDDLSVVFRENADQGKTRVKNTPEPSIISQNLKTFIAKWKNMPDNDIFSEIVQKKLSNLESHIVEGCLSNIPPGQGTERNENLHRILNSSVLSHARAIGPELAAAVLTVLFFYMNEKLINKDSSPLLCRNYVKVKKILATSNSVTSSEKFGFLGQTRNKHHLSAADMKQKSLGIIDNKTTENVDVLLSDDTASVIISETLDLHEVIQKLSERSTSKNMNPNDFPYIPLNHTLCFLGGRFGDSCDDIEAHVQRLERNLSRFNLIRYAVAGDGDCAFACILQQIQLLNDPPNSHLSDLTLHLRSLDIMSPYETKENIIKLRQLFVDD